MKVILADAPKNRLREPSEEVTDFDELPALVDKMIEALDDHPGISAPQLGKNLRVFVINKSVTRRKEHLVAINPQVTPQGKEVIEAEACLSLPNQTFEVTRKKRCKIKYQDFDGNWRTFKVKRFPARVMQHEIDHLDGILIDKSGQPIPIEKA